MAIDRARDVPYVGRQLGHTMQRTTDLYAHVLEDLEQHLVNLTDEPTWAVATPSGGAWRRRCGWCGRGQPSPLRHHDGLSGFDRQILVG
ncbi:MAG: hypothetical protein ACREM3_03690 [Candidatus Rokuibacteriota bacterium]